MYAVGADIARFYRWAWTGEKQPRIGEGASRNSDDANSDLESPDLANSDLANSDFDRPEPNFGDKKQGSARKNPLWRPAE